VSNRGYKCVFAAPNVSRCLPISSPDCFRSRLLERAREIASSSVSTAPPLVCAFAQGNWQSAATNTQLIADRRTSITSSARKAHSTGWSTMQDRSIFPVFQCPPRDLILAREPYVFMAPCVGQKTIQYANAVCMSVDPVVHADQHQATAARTFFLELVELVA
jgi:hypothetical protein